MRQQCVEVGKNKLFSRQPFQLLLSKLSNSPNKHRKHWLGCRWLAQPSSAEQAQPIPFPTGRAVLGHCLLLLSEGWAGALLRRSPPRLCTPFWHHRRCRLAQGSFPGVPLQLGGHLSLQRWTTSRAWQGCPCTLLCPAWPLANSTGLPYVGLQGQGERTSTEMLWPTCEKGERAEPSPLGVSVEPTALEMGAGCWSSQPGEDPWGSAIHGDRNKLLCPQ